ncbi:TIGR02450 family Trp-rich protein [Halomonas sp. YLGW01]|uniref:TIGR02450 family Trp-rich protein n=1 Tax=Halomonas sp. YLGW01 TaxID=2773308 RepID=UPI001784A401|nr:TIGR02450 family Trp-rich protein [Halomonas sp. YLGW01]
MHAINPEKLHHSKWTAVAPKHKEKHFLAIKLVRDEEEKVVQVVLEAVLTRRQFTLPWQALRDDTSWRMGWQ